MPTAPERAVVEGLLARDELLAAWMPPRPRRKPVARMWFWPRHPHSLRQRHAPPMARRMAEAENAALPHQTEAPDA